MDQPGRWSGHAAPKPQCLENQPCDWTCFTREVLWALRASAVVPVVCRTNGSSDWMLLVEGGGGEHHEHHEHLVLCM